MLYPRRSVNLCFAQTVLQSDFAALGKGGNAVGGAESERFDGHGGLAPAGGDEAAAIAEKKIVDVVGAVGRINDRGLRIIAHAAGTEKMEGEIVFLIGIVPGLQGTGGVGELQGARSFTRLSLELLRMVFVGRAQCVQTPEV